MVFLCWSCHMGAASSPFFNWGCFGKFSLTSPILGPTWPWNYFSRVSSNLSWQHDSFEYILDHLCWPKKWQYWSKLEIFTIVLITHFSLGLIFSYSRVNMSFFGFLLKNFMWAPKFSRKSKKLLKSRLFLGWGNGKKHISVKLILVFKFENLLIINHISFRNGIFWIPLKSDAHD